MVTENQLLSYTELVNEIKTSCDNMISGTLLIITENSLLIRIILDEGKITAMICGTHHAMDVIPSLHSVTACRLKLSASKIGKSSETPLPPTQQILDQLFTKASGATGKAPAEVSTENIGSDHEVAAVLSIIEEELIEFLGPMASIVWQEHLGKMAQPIYSASLGTLINGLSREIGDAENVNTFKMRIKKKVDSM